MARYFLNIGTDWSNTANWSDTDGGAGGFSVPTSADDVLFTALSGNCTVNILNANCKNLDFTGYANTIAVGVNNINLSGNTLIYSAAMSNTGTGTIYILNPCSITSNGYVWIGRTFFSCSTGGVTLIDDLTTKNCQWGFTGLGALNGVGRVLNVDGNFTISGGQSTAGTITKVKLIGTGTLSGPAGFFQGNLEIDSGLNTVTITNPIFASAVFTYVGGLLDLTASNLVVGGSFLTLVNFSAYTFNALSLRSASIVNCTNHVNVNIVSFYVSGTATINGPNKLYVYTAMTVGASDINGTGTIEFAGNVTWTGALNFGIRTNLIFNSPGTITISGIVSFSTGTFTYVAAASVITTGSTLSVLASATLNISGINLNNVTALAGTVTLTSALNCVNFTHTTTATWNGTINVSGNFSHSVLSGTGDINMIGTGSWITSGANMLKKNLTFNTSGTISLGSNVYFGGIKTLKYMSGIFNPNTFSLNITTSSAFDTISIDTFGIFWYAVNITGIGPSIKLDSKLNVIGRITLINTLYNFTGAAGFECGELYMNTTLTTDRDVLLKAGNTYIVNNSLTLKGNAGGFKIQLKSSTTSHAFFNLNVLATQDVSATRPTWIDSSGGQTIKTTPGIILSNTINWAYKASSNFFFLFQ